MDPHSGWSGVDLACYLRFTAASLFQVQDDPIHPSPFAQLDAVPREFLAQ